jgi:3-phenylpropionate/cinnamic acid dioxygenase small subunit
VSVPAQLRNELEDLYADYADAIDSGALERWPMFFCDPCLYRVVSKENYDQGLPMSLMRCESIGMLTDRAFAAQKLNVYGPRVWRHTISHLRAKDEASRIVVQANFALFETLHDQHTRVLVTGRYLDKLVRTGNGLKFHEKLCVYDSALIPGSIVAPI